MISDALPERLQGRALVTEPTAYPWCSAAWFERTASRAFQQTLANLKIDRLNVLDDFLL